MQIYIYRCEGKKDAFLFLPQKGEFEKLPKTLNNMLGVLHFSFEFKLVEGKKLLRTEASTVIKTVQEYGYYLQLPPSTAKEKISDLYFR